MANDLQADLIYDYLIIGSGFGGAVCAMRLTEKGYKVLVLEKGKRFREQDFAKSNWQFWKYVWMPFARSFGILEISLLKGMMVLHGAGVGGGSLGYANALEIPNEETFATPPWNTPIHWGEVLMPYYRIAQKMLGTTAQPGLMESGRGLEADGGGDRPGPHFPGHRGGGFLWRRGQNRAGPVFRRAGSRAHRLPAVRGLPGGLPLQFQEHPAQELPVFCRKRRGQSAGRGRGGGYPAHRKRSGRGAL